MTAIDRRMVLAMAAAGVVGARRALAATVTLPFGNGERPLLQYPGKQELLQLTSRPPQLETPMSVFNKGLITPNDEFFVRYHLAGIPLEIDPATFRLEIAGLVNTPLNLTLDDLKKLGATHLVAVNQCSGNGRGFFEPRVAGGQAGNGLMGNARWTGVPLKTVLERAGLKPGVIQARFDGLDGPVLETTPDFVKSLPIEHANDGTVMLAWSMNGADLPWLNGYPLRLIVPGYYGTYWMKHLNKVTLVDTPVKTFWMDTAYRIPDNECNCVEPGTTPAKTKPIGRFKVRSFITSLADGAQVPAGQATVLRGIAFDGGSGIKTVEVSVDDGHSWQTASLGENLGNYSFRGWHHPVTLGDGEHKLQVRATANDGGTQPKTPPWNPSGYLRNIIETVTVRAA